MISRPLDGPLRSRNQESKIKNQESQSRPSSIVRSIEHSSRYQLPAGTVIVAVLPSPSIWQRRFHDDGAEGADGRRSSRRLAWNVSVALPDGSAARTSSSSANVPVIQLCSRVPRLTTGAT